MIRALVIAGWISAGLLIFALGWLIGVGAGLDQMRQQAVDEGYAVREPDGGFRWRSGDELERRPARRRE